jgi:hypothetical protein
MSQMPANEKFHGFFLGRSIPAAPGWVTDGLVPDLERSTRTNHQT